MKIVHLIQANSNFTSFVKIKAKSSNQLVIDYDIVPYVGLIKIRYFLDLYRYYKVDKNTLFIFHQVPFFSLLVLSIFLKNIRYALYFWGGDFYDHFLPVSQLEAYRHRKNNRLQPPLPNKKFIPSLWFLTKRFVAHFVVKRSAAIVSLNKRQFRILRMQYIKLFKEPLVIPYFNLVEYNNFESPSFAPRLSSNELTFLICHSAASTLNHQEAISLIKKYKELWDVKVNIRGFLSYGGRSNTAVDLLEKTLIKEASFAETVLFEKTFLDHHELLEKLKFIDIALFSCIRDEGVSMLSQLVRLGGVLVFEKSSINFHYFRAYARDKTLNYSIFLSTPPQDLMKLRNEEAEDPPVKVEYEELNTMLFKKHKLISTFIK